MEELVCIVCGDQFKDIPDVQGCNVCDKCNEVADKIDKLNRSIERAERDGDFERARELTIELLAL